MNTASSLYSTVGGGQENTANGGWSTLGGGNLSTAHGHYSSILGGLENQTGIPGVPGDEGRFSAIGGGYQNRIEGQLGAVAGGQGKLAGRIIRIGHIGYVEMFDIITAFSALEMALNDLGYEFGAGSGIAAVQKVFMDNDYPGSRKQEKIYG